jgi:WD40 repeat protein
MATHYAILWGSLFALLAVVKAVVPCTSHHDCAEFQYCAMDGCRWCEQCNLSAFIDTSNQTDPIDGNCSACTSNLYEMCTDGDSSKILDFTSYYQFTSASVTHDSTTLAAASGNFVILYDYITKAGNIIAVLTGHTAPVRSVTFSPDDFLLASAGDDNSVRMWNWRTGTTLFVWTHSSVINQIVFSPSGNYLAASTTDGKVLIYKSTGLTGLYRTFTGHTGQVRSVDFSPDSAYVLSAGEDMTWRYWNISSGAQIKSIPTSALTLTVFF